MSSGGPDLSVDVGPVALANPVLCASGTLGHGEEAGALLDLTRLGGIVGKSISLEPRDGNPPPRIHETACGLLNSIGLQNPGLDAYLDRILPGLLELGTPVIPNVVGRSDDELVELCTRLDAVDGPAALEVNLSCPNVEEGGVSFSHDARVLGETVRRLREATDLPLWVKLSPNVTDIGAMGVVAAEAGADALTVANTFIGLAVDWRARRPVLGGGTGGLSGPAIKPLALRAVHEVREATGGRVPILGVGGISTAEDVLEYVCAGASAVQVGTATFRDPLAAIRIVEELPRLLEAEELAGLDALRGSLADDPRPATPH